nr:MAG TPA: hypothetical protein [Caudoviricetes sp.]
MEFLLRLLNKQVKLQSHAHQLIMPLYHLSQKHSKSLAAIQ